MSQTQQIEPTDSISSQDPHAEPAKKTKSRRPPNTAFRQQRLKAWQPILTPKTVLPIFFIVGIIFAPIGGALLYASSKVQELQLDYTNCFNESPETTLPIPADAESPLEDMHPDRVTTAFKKPLENQPRWAHSTKDYTWPVSNKTINTNVCILEFNIPENVEPPILFYYRLTNFYQNHRRYVKSLDINQLKGDAVDVANIRSGECDPLDVAPAENGRPEMPYYPCGLIANSMFNDTFGNLTALGRQGGGYDFTDKGISWSTESDLYGKTKYKPNEVVPPINWQEQYENGSYEGLKELPNLHEDEAFQVWMRTAGLPTFSKLAKRNNDETLTQGTYQLEIFDRFPATSYGGQKFILISTRTIMGGRNPFLGIAYVVVGGLCILLGTVFTLTHLVKPRKLGDHTYLSWNNEPSTATGTGRAQPGSST